TVLRYCGRMRRCILVQPRFPSCSVFCSSLCEPFADNPEWPFSRSGVVRVRRQSETLNPPHRVMHTRHYGPGLWFFTALAVACSLAAPASGQGFWPNQPSGDWREPLLPRDWFLGDWANPTAEKRSFSRSALRIPLFRMPSGFLQDPVGLVDDDDLT